MKFHPLKICMVNYMNGKELENGFLSKVFLDEFIDVDFSIKYFSSDLNRELYLGDMFFDEKENKIFTFSLFNKTNIVGNSEYTQGISSFGFVNIQYENSKIKYKTELSFNVLRKKKNFFKRITYIGNIFRHKTIDKDKLELNGHHYNQIHSELMKAKQFMIISNGTEFNFNSIKNYEFNILENILKGNFNILINYKRMTLNGLLDFSYYTGEILELNISLDKFNELYFNMLKNNKMDIVLEINKQLKIDKNYLKKSILFYNNYLIYLDEDGKVVEYNGEMKCYGDEDMYMLTSDESNNLYNHYIPSLSVGYDKKLLAII